MKTDIRYPPTVSIEAHYAYAMKINDGNVGPHLPRLKALATGAALCVEFGVRRGGSSAALLLGAQRVISYDVKATPEAEHLAHLAGERWSYHLQSSLEVEIPSCDLLFVDSLHTYRQCDAELRRHADQAQRYLVFHDSIWRGVLGEPHRDLSILRPVFNDQAKREAVLGIRPAVDNLMVRDRSWQIAAHYTDSCGLLVLERR